MLMIAIVREVRPRSLLVRDRATGQTVIVHVNQTCCFFIGDIVSIWYNGVMAQSFPPQITAMRIRRIFPTRGC